MGKELRVAVVDDLKEDSQIIAEYLTHFQEEKGVHISTDVYNASFDFLEKYHGEYDVIFLDIEMPGSNGLEVAREIRAKDNAVGIVFVTGMAQYALEGYEVNAIDFIVKPVSYYNFSVKLEKAFRFCQNRNSKDILVSSREGIHRFAAGDIRYIEKNRDDMVFHTIHGEYRMRGSIKTLKEKLDGLPFSECTAGCLVNLNSVVHIGKDVIGLEDGTELPLSRRLKKKFSEEYIRYIGG